MFIIKQGGEEWQACPECALCDPLRKLLSKRQVAAVDRGELEVVIDGTSGLNDPLAYQPVYKTKRVELVPVGSPAW